MIKEILIKQKQELEKLLERFYVKRNKTNEIATEQIENDLVKVVIGPRRAGKSVFAAHLFKDKKPAYINFDEENLVKVDNYDEFIKELFALYGEKKYLFFDEIQNLPNWELFINKLHRQGYNILLTGSNAKLLSKELATSLTGRHIPIEILPFDFKEYLKLKNFIFKEEELAIPKIKGELLNHLTSYMVNGGFPELAVKNLEPKGYLDILLDSLIFKDIVKRYKIRLSEKIYNLEIYLLNNFASEFTFRKLTKALNFNSDVTLEKFLRYLEECYLVCVLSRYSHKTIERLSSPKKAYLIDNGYIAAKAIQYSPNNGKLMENLVFSELLKMNYKPNHNLFYYKTRNAKEVDFILRDDLKIKQLIQVAYRVDEIGVKSREMNALIEAGEELKCDNLMILTWDYENKENFKGKNINFIPLWKWLIK